MEDDAGKITEQVENMEGEFSGLTTRMDKDFELWNLTEMPPSSGYDVLTKQITGAHETDVNIVSNDLRTFSDRCRLYSRMRRCRFLLGWPKPRGKISEMT